MSRTELVGGFAVPRTDTLSGQMHEHYVKRIGALPRQTRQMLTLAAADPTGDSALFWRAALALGLDPEAAVRRNRISCSKSAATYDSGIPSPDRLPMQPVPMRIAHRHTALAAATDAQTDPERRGVAPGRRSNRPGRSLAVSWE